MNSDSLPCVSLFSTKPALSNNLHEKRANPLTADHRACPSTNATGENPHALFPASPLPARPHPPCRRRTKPLRRRQLARLSQLLWHPTLHPPQPPADRRQTPRPLSRIQPRRHHPRRRLPPLRH